MKSFVKCDKELRKYAIRSGPNLSRFLEHIFSIATLRIDENGKLISKIRKGMFKIKRCILFSFHKGNPTKTAKQLPKKPDLLKFIRLPEIHKQSRANLIRSGNPDMVLKFFACGDTFDHWFFSMRNSRIEFNV